jgi:hypothetical protein
VIPHWAGGFLSRLQRGRFAYAQKTKPFTGPFQNGLVHSPGRINRNICRSFLSLERNLLFLSEYAGSSGVPIEVSRKGKAPPLERGRGKAFPACEPGRVTAEGILSEEMIGSDPQNSSLDEKQWVHEGRLTFLRELREHLLCLNKPF